MNFGIEIKAVVAAHADNMDRIDNEERSLEQQVKQERITGKVALEKRKVLEDQRAAAHLSAAEKIRQLHREHDEAVDRWDMPDGSKLTDDAKLLSADFPMNQAQFQMLCDKYWDNSVMLRLLAQYADRHPDEQLFADRPADAAARKEIFADFAGRAIGALRDHNCLMTALFLDRKTIRPEVMYEY